MDYPNPTLGTLITGPLADALEVVADMAKKISIPMIVVDVNAMPMDDVIRWGQTARSQGVALVVLANRELPFDVMRNMGTVINA